MEIDAFKNKIKTTPVQPVYFIYGDEPFYIDQLGEYIVNETVNPEMKDFNFTALYGKEVDSGSVLDTLMRYPMMAPFQVVLLKEAQQMKNFSDLLPYLQKPMETTVFIIEYKKSIDKRFKLFKMLSALDTAFESTPVRDYKIAKWIGDYVKGLKWSIQADTTRLLAEYLGTDLQKIVNELDKIMLNKKGNSEITSDDIEKYVGISKEYNIFELQKAIGGGNKPQAVQIISMMMENEKENSPVMIISMLFAYFTKIYKMHFLRSASQNEQLKNLGLSHSFFLGEFQQAAKIYGRDRCETILDLLHEYDLKSKGFNYPSGGSGDLIKEMMYRIIN